MLGIWDCFPPRVCVPEEAVPFLWPRLQRLLVMSPGSSPRRVSELPVCRSREISRTEWNRFVRNGVVHGVRNRRKLCAAVLAAGLVLSGCASGGEESPTTTTTAVAESPSNPWDLPLEQRPPLFDPCEEIPVAVVEEAIGGPTDAQPNLSKSELGVLQACGWRSEDVLLDVAATWKSFDRFLVNPTGVIDEIDTQVTGRSALRMTDRADGVPDVCRYFFFTERGTVVASVGLNGTLGEFRGERFTHVCDALDAVAGPIVQLIPEGDFR